MKRGTRRCHCCGKTFSPRPQVPKQQYCGEQACQRARKRDWQKERRRHDPDYRENQREAQKRWASRHPDYWRQWREGHPEYRERNRRQQAERNVRQRAAEPLAPPVSPPPLPPPLPPPPFPPGSPVTDAAIAKNDVWTRESGLNPGTYRVTPWTAGMDCKEGRVNSGNLFLISQIGTQMA